MNVEHKYIWKWRDLMPVVREEGIDWMETFMSGASDWLCERTFEKETKGTHSVIVKEWGRFVQLMKIEYASDGSIYFFPHYYKASRAKRMLFEVELNYKNSTMRELKRKDVESAFGKISLHPSGFFQISWPWITSGMENWRPKAFWFNSKCFPDITKESEKFVDFHYIEWGPIAIGTFWWMDDFKWYETEPRKYDNLIFDTETLLECVSKDEGGSKTHSGYTVEIHFLPKKTYELFLKHGDAANGAFTKIHPMWFVNVVPAIHNEQSDIMLWLFVYRNSLLEFWSASGQALWFCDLNTTENELGEKMGRQINILMTSEDG